MTSLPNYRPRVPPYDKQREALEQGWERRGFGYLLDLGCVDADTEYLSSTGWRRIADYDGGLVAQFDLDGTAQLVQPLAYIKQPCDMFYHYRSERGIDQMLSREHRVLYCGKRTVRALRLQAGSGVEVGRVPDGYRRREVVWTEAWREVSAEELALTGRVIHIPTVFNLNTRTEMRISDAELRLQIAFHADGSYNTRDLTRITALRKGGIRVKKEYKKERLIHLLKEADTHYKEHVDGVEGFMKVSFYPPRISKTYGPEWWACSREQRLIVAEEAFRWDGSNTKSGGRTYRSMHKSDADFIQWCLVSTGQRASIYQDGDGCWSVHAIGDGKVDTLAVIKDKPEPTPSPDGFKYCFTVPSSYLVLRRNGRVFATGNCGKSKTVIDNWMMLHEEHSIDGMLLIAPNGIHSNWTRVDPEWNGEFPVPIDKNPGQFQMHIWRDYWPTLRQYTWRSKGKRALRECEAFVRDQVTPGLQVLAVNIEALAAAGGVFELCEMFLRQRKCMIVLDESILIKDRRSSRTKLMWRLARWAQYRRILTGRPSKGSPSDVWAQFEFLEKGCLGHTSFYTFQRQYCKTREIYLGPRRVLTEVGAQNLEELADRLKQHAFRVRKEDCLDLPPKVRLPWCEIKMNDEQTRLYKEMTEQAIVTLADGSTVSATIALTQIEKLHQIACGHLRLDDGTVRWLGDERLEALLDIISKTREQVVIWCAYRPDQGRVTRALEELYGADKVARWYGDVPVPEREEGEARFKRGEARYLVASQYAGARGRDWTAGTLCIYYSDTHDLELRDQSEDRLHRGGQTRSVSYIDMVVRGTIDEKILKSHATKTSVIDQITRDGARAVLKYVEDAK